MSAPRHVDLPFTTIAQACQIAAVDIHGIDEATVETVRFELIQDGETILGRVHFVYKPIEPLDVAPAEVTR